MVFLRPLNLILYLFSPCLAVLWNFLSFTLWFAGPPSFSICPVSTLSPAMLLSLAETPPARKDFIPCPARFSVDRHCLADRGCGWGYACLFNSHVSQDPIPWGWGRNHLVLGHWNSTTVYKAHRKLVLAGEYISQRKTTHVRFSMNGMFSGCPYFHCSRANPHWSPTTQLWSVRKTKAAFIVLFTQVFCLLTLGPTMQS